MNRRERRSREEKLVREEQQNIFSSVIMMLLVFFIFIYSFSTVDQGKFESVKKSIQSSLLGRKDASGPIENSLNKDKIATKDENNKNLLYNEELYNKVNKFIIDNKLAAIIEIRKEDRGTSLQMKDSSLFEAGKADLISDNKKVLDKVSDFLNIISNNVVVEGHTDNTQINTFKFETNWDLSAERAVTVVRYFTEEKGLDPYRFSATGYGEYKPIADNKTPENRAKNKRINILILASEKGR